jgi:hypothetical protein
MSSDQPQKNNVVEFPVLRGSTTRFFKLDMLVLDVLTPFIGFENGAYALHLAGYQHLGDLAASSPAEISKVAGMSPSKIRKVRSFLRQHDLDYGVDATDWQRCRMPKISSQSGRPDHPRKPVPVFLTVVQ